VRVLLDTCVLSELRHPKGNPRVRQAVDAFNDEELFVSVISIGEIFKGVSLLRQGPKRRTLETWLQTLERDYGDRLLAIDLETCPTVGGTHRARTKSGAGRACLRRTYRRHGATPRAARHDPQHR
jgi:toxin FitB